MIRRSMMLKGLVIAVFLSVVGVVSYVSALNVYFFDTQSGSCDVTDAFGTEAITGTSKCGDPNAQISLMAGETSTVPVQRVRVTVYFKNLQAANGTLDITKFNNAQPYVDIPGFSYCPGQLQGANKQDILRNGYFADNPSKLNYLDKITVFSFGPTFDPSENKVVGGESYNALYRGPASTHCDTGHSDFTRRIMVKSGWLKPVQGISNLMAVEFLATHYGNQPQGQGVETAGAECAELPPSALRNCDGVANGFRLQQGQAGTPTPDTTAYIASSTNDNTSFGSNIGNGVTIRKTHDDQDLSYRLRFGADCTVVGAATRLWVPIKLYDLDYDTGNPVKVRLYDETRAQWKKPGTYNNSSLVDANEWQNTRPTYAQADQVPFGFKLTVSYSFHAEADHDYTLEILNNTGTIVFQYGLPFDGIYNKYNCKQGFIANASINGSSVEAGQPATAVASVKNTSAPDRAAANRKFWYSNVNDWTTLGAGVQIPPSTTITNPGLPGWVTGTTSLPAWNVASVDGTYKYLCTNLTVTPQNVALDVSSDGECIPIGKYPSLQATGGDIRAGGVVPVNSNCQISGNDAAGFIEGHAFASPGAVKGSKGEFAVLSGGALLDFGSANILANSSANPTWKKLYFGSSLSYQRFPLGVAPADGFYYLSRTQTAGALGAGATSHCLTNLVSSYPPKASSTLITANTTVNTPADGGAGTTINEQYVFAATADNQTSTLALPAYSLDSSQSVTIRIGAPTTCDGGDYIVRLTGNVQRLNYATVAYTSVQQIPQFALIVTSPCIRLVVADAVTELYGMYATSGNVYTCDGGAVKGFDNNESNNYGPSRLTSTNCANALKFFGTVIVGKQLFPYRTQGDGTTGAEIFSLDPIYTISDYVRSRTSTTLRVDTQKELPPRY